MNRWDLFTWICAVLLTVGSIVIFGFFLGDLGVLLKSGSGKAR